MNLGPLNEIFNNKLVFLRRHGPTYQALGKKYFSTDEKVRFKKKLFQVPKHSSATNKWGKNTYFLDFDKGSQIMFKTDTRKGTTFSAADMDMFLERGFISGFVQTFKAKKNKEWGDILLGLMAGVGVGFMIYHFIQMVV